MAATFDSTSNSGAINASSASWSHTLGGGSNLVLAVLVGNAAGTPGTVSSVTYGAQNLSQLSGANVSNGFGRVEIWRLAEGTPPSGNQTVAVTMSGAVELYAGAIVAKDANQTTAFGTVATNTGASSPMSLTVTSAADEIAVATICAGISSSQTFTTTAGVERWNLSNGIGTSIGVGVTIEGSPSAGFAWTSGEGSLWSAVGVSIKAATTGTWKTTLGLPTASISTRLGLARSSIKTMLGLTP